MKVNRDEAIDAVFLSAAKPEPMIEKVTFEPVKDAPPEETADDYYQKGLQAKAGSNLKDAKAYFLKAVQLDNKLPAAYNNLGIIYEQEGKPKKAEEMYLKAVSVDPQYAPAYSNLALFNEGRGDSAKALGFWRKRVLYGNPNDEWTKKAIQRIRELEW
jgi:tetratricopeptide (TPR) repeat protein